MRSFLPPIALAVLLLSGTIDADAQPSSAPSGLLASGLAALNAADYAKAETELAQVKGPGEAEAKLALGRAALEQGKFADADKHAQAAAANATLKNRATVLRAEILGAQGKLAEAIALLTPLKAVKGNDGRRARIFLAQYLIRTGKKKDADEPLKKIVQEYNDDDITGKDAEGLAYAGRATFLLGAVKDSNKLFKDAEDIDKNRVETFLWAAELFLDKYDAGHAEEELKDAFKIAPKHPDALIAHARVKLDQSLEFEEAEKIVKKVLAINPRHTGALAVRAGIALRDMDIAGADKAIAEGLAVNPNDLELLSLKAAGRFLDDDMAGFEAMKKQVLAKNPEYSRFYSIVGEYAEWEHRYDDIVTMMKEAVKLEPTDAKAWAELGLTQMRGGDEDEGFKSIQQAWKHDHYNVRVFNTLDMYEKEIPNHYDTVADGVFKVRYAKDEKPVMERYVPRMLGEAWGSMKARYGFVPTVPVQVEMYGSRQTFSVRTSGLPNIGIQGVCFGRVVAAISPKAEPFNYGNVLWHELGHVFAIQMSKNHVPRWFTEGLSEYETIARRPEWARELDPELYQAIKSGKLPGAVDMNRAFTHASDASDVTTAYYAASQMLIWTVEKFGMNKVVLALKLWGQGKKTPDVLQGAFGLSPDAYDKGYREWQMARLKRYDGQYLFNLKPKDIEEVKKNVAANPKDARAHVELAVALFRTRKAADAKKELEAAFAIDPKNGDAHFVAAQVAKAEKDPEGAKKHLDTMRSTGNDGYTIHSMLADIAEEQKNDSAMRFHLEAAHRFDPSQSEPLKGLFDLANQAKREGDALAALEKLAQLEQHDRKVWRMLLDRLVTAKRWDDARRIGESAIFVDVLGGQTHALYAKALSASNAHDKAVFELETATMCPGKPPEKATHHALLAQEYLAVKRPADAKKALDEALKLDPENAEAKNVKIP